MSSHQGVTTRPRPRVSPDSAPFWEGCREGRLMLPFCRSCGKPHLPPGPVCPHCFSDDLEWRQASGRGFVSTWTVVHKAWFPVFAADIPYNVIQVELEEGPRLTARLVGHGADALAVGMPVVVGFERIDDDLALPCFRRA